VNRLPYGPLSRPQGHPRCLRQLQMAIDRPQWPRVARSSAACAGGVRRGCLTSRCSRFVSTGGYGACGPEFPSDSPRTKEIEVGEDGLMMPRRRTCSVLPDRHHRSPQAQPCT
jgi:hypothetical protein